MIPIRKLDHRRRPSRWSPSTLLGRIVGAVFAGIVPLAIVTSATAPVLAQSSPAPRSELSIWQSVDPRILDHLASAVLETSEGAVGNNRNGFTQVGLENQSSWITPKALVEKDPADLARAIRLISYGFSHELPNGDFQYSVGTSGSAPTELSKDGSTAFFLADVGESLGLMNESTWFRSSPEAANERNAVAQIMPAYRRAVDWLLGRASVLESDRAAVNRTFIYSNAFGFGGALLNDSAATAQSRSFVDDAVSRQLPDGTFPEAGGFDSSYQGVSIFLAQVRFVNLQDASERTRLWQAIQLAVARERPSISADGIVSTQGNTRIAASGERLFGVTKRVDGRSVTLGFVFYSILSGAPDVKALGASLAHRYHIDGT